MLNRVKSEALCIHTRFHNSNGTFNGSLHSFFVKFSLDNVFTKASVVVEMYNFNPISHKAFSLVSLIQYVVYVFD